MKTKIAYVLVSDSGDYFLEQLILSILSVRLHNNATIWVIVDKTTYDGLIDNRHILFDLANNIIAVDVPNTYSKQQTSRFIKTSLRRIITDDYLFIDCDTIICEDLSEIDNIPYQIAAVADLNESLILSNSQIISNCRRAGFHDLKGKPYFNSGIMLVKDSKDCQKFYDEWHKNWLYSVQNGINLDQPALCIANAISGCIIHELDGNWNCQVNFNGEKFVKTAHILHYAGGSDKISIRQILQYIRSIDNIPNTLISDLLSQPRTTLFALMTIRDEQYIHYCYSPILYYYYHKSHVFSISLKLSKILSIFYDYANKVKQLIKSNL